MYARTDKIWLSIWRLHNVYGIRITRVLGKSYRRKCDGEREKGKKKAEKNDAVLSSDDRYESRAICPPVVCGKSKAMLKGAASGTLRPWCYRECSPPISWTPT